MNGGRTEADAAATKSGWNSLGVMALVLIFALCVRIPGMGASVWLDETFCSRIKIGPPLVLARTLLSDYHPPAYFLFQHVWIGVFGDSELAIRMPALLSALAAVALMLRLGSRVAGPRAGFLAALLLALSPAHIWYSHEARPYSTTLLVVMIAAHAWYRLAEPDLDGRSVKRWTWGFALALAFGLFSHYFVLAFLGAFVIVAWLCVHARRKRLTVVASILGAAFCAFFFVKSMLSPIHTGSDYLKAFTPARFWELNFNWFWTGNAFTPRLDAAGGSFGLLLTFEIIALVFALLGLRRLLRGDLRAKDGAAGFALPLLWVALPTLLLILPYLGLDRSFIERSALPALPFFLLIVAVGVDGIGGRLRTALPVFVTVLAAVVLSFSWRNREAWTVYKTKPDWRAASEWISERIEADAGVQELFALDLSPYALSYYDDRIQLAKSLEPNETSYERLRGTLESKLGAQSAIGEWALESLDEQWRAEGERLDQLRSELRVRILSLDMSTTQLPQREPGSVLFFIHEPWRPAQDSLTKRLIREAELEVVESIRVRSLEVVQLRRL